MPRRVITISGIVQGVGFRPFVYDLAHKLHISGSVRNDGGKVLIEAEGDNALLDIFLKKLHLHAPPLARIEGITWAQTAPKGTRQFSIQASEIGSQTQVLVSPDLATCKDCAAELFDCNDRRFKYPLINCTNCGPRLTIITSVPYDRVRTTMVSFPMCGACQQEYENPVDRRFHAQPTACPRCGPSLVALDERGQAVEVQDPVQYAAAALQVGSIGALKGVGGYHLICDAQNKRAVNELRRRKHRDSRPFAIMLPDVEAVMTICDVSSAEEILLKSSAGPIVLLRQRTEGLARDIAPNNHYLGVMLPYSPVHHLLMRAVGNVPLVMTSANQSDEPIAYDDQDAVRRLGKIADFFLVHDRPIYLRCDDSVVRVVANRPLPVRRSRGYAPAPIQLPFKCSRTILATGGQLKCTFALGRDQHAILSHHLGDVSYYETYRAYVEAVAHYERLFAIEPQVIVHDFHPDYATTVYAMERGGQVQRLAVQHHHAHLASCMAEHGVNEPVIGVIFDGAGFGTDKAVWGGEFLIGDYRGYRRTAHFRYVPMPGGERAVREPWRMALAYSFDAGIHCDALSKQLPTKAVDAVRQMIERGFNTPSTSSAGRLFDAVAALAGVRTRVDHEGQAAMELEWLATDVPPAGSYPFAIAPPGQDTLHDSPFQVDTRPLIVAIIDDLRRGEPAATVARRFHSTLVEIIVQVCARLRNETGVETVALSGGVFMNALLLNDTISRLTEESFCVLRHEQVPPNDGGLCLGQLAIAAALQNCDNE